MAASARRKITITYSGDVEGEQELNAANNTASPAQIENVVLADGANTITVPAGATAVTIAKPADNTYALLLKSVDGDTGVRLHDTDPDTLSLDDSVASFVINATLGEVGTCTLRLFWS